MRFSSLFRCTGSLLAAAFVFSCSCPGPGAGDGGPGENGGDGGPSFDGGLTTRFVVEPTTAELVVTQRNTPVSQAFTAKDVATSAVLQVTWVPDRDDLGTLGQDGVFTTQSLVGGTVKVRASHNGEWAEATLRIRVDLRDTNPSGNGALDPAVVNQLDNPTAPSTSQGPKILYPYAQTVFPRGIISPLVQYDPQGFAPTGSRITVNAPNFTWTGYLPVMAAAKPRFAIPEDVWDAALRNASGGAFSLDVTQANSSMGYGPVRLPLIAAPGSLKGSVYYMTYAEGSLGVWRVATATKEAPTHVVQGCGVCHSVSANGQHLVVGSEDTSKSGVYQLLPDGGVPKITGAPSGLGGDSRGISFAANTPDGKYMVRSQNDFWGGKNLKAFLIDDVGKKLTEAEVVGMGDAVSAYIPSISPDGRFIAFTTGQGDTSLGANPTKALNVMNLTVDSTVMPAGRLTFSNRRTIVDTGAMGPVVKFATFLPNTQMLAYQEHTSGCTANAGMLPTWSAACTHGSRSPGRLMFIDTSATGTMPVPMSKANAGLDNSAEWQNYEPFALPTPSGGYYWVAFTSIRDYGNTYQGAAARKQLWVTAVSTHPGPNEDPSHPAFYLPNQKETENERGYWALDPCKDVGEGCASGGECCAGFCREFQEGTQKVCSQKTQTCSQEGERCQTADDCCPPFEGLGLQCLGGFCGH